MKTLVKFYEGLKGSGVVVSVSYQQSRVIFDFGSPFLPETQVYDGVVHPREKNWVKDAIRLGKIPAIDGVFAQKDIQGLQLIPAENSELTTAILISHLHLDHMSQIGMVHPRIPVYIHKNGYDLELALREVGESVGTREFQFHDYHEEINIGAIRVTSFFSDHPCYGSCSYFIKTPDQNIFYTGDIRYHGLQAQRAFAEIEALSQETIDLLIVDGTTYSPEMFAFESNYHNINCPSKDIIADMISEQEIYDDIYHKLEHSKALAIFNVYHRDMQLIESLLTVAKSLKRTLVFEPETAYVYQTLFPDEEINYYIPDFKHYLDDNSIINKISKHAKIVSIETIKNSPHEFFVQSSYKYIMQLHDFVSDEKNEYFHLFGDPFDKKGVAYLRFEKCMTLFHCNLHAYSNLYSFNHAYPNHLSYIIETLDPKLIVSVHSNHPEKLHTVNRRQFFPEKGVEYELVNGTLKELD